MSEVQERRIVRCPYHRAATYLARIIRSRVGSELPLTLTLSVPGAELVKNVSVSYDAATDPMHFDQPWHVHWKPLAGPYPEFDGELTVRADDTYESAQLELRGSYAPPGGVAGAAFDRVVGQRIASATAQALLERVGKELEEQYQHDERAKASAP